MTPGDRHPELLRVVLVSPGDVAEERDAVKLVVDDLNRRVAPANGCQLSLWRWETDARPGLHLEGPQGLIDERMEIADSDVVVGIFWKRFGTPTGDTQSGTEHELRRAWAAWREHQRPDVMVYFSQQPASPSTSTELEQWHRELKFREELPKEQLWWSYTTPVEFVRLIRAHLERVILDRARQHTPAAAAREPRRAPVRFNLPLVPLLFVGRTRERAALEEALQVADRAVVTQAITGLGGVGKTRLAEHYVSAHLDEYDVVAWIQAEDGGVADLSALAAALGEPVDGLSPAERRDRALAHLARGEERWLLVLDNIDSPAQLEGCLPRGGGGRVLVTSRNQEVRHFAPAVSLDVFDEPTAVDYLTERAGRTDDRAGAQRLAQALGYLPLALTQAAAYCTTGTSFDEYLELLDALPAETLFDTNREASHEQTVTSTWRASIAAASAEAPLAADVLAMAAHLGPDAIPKSLFGVLIDGEQPLERKRLGDAFNALARLSLATVGDTTLGVHRLLQKVVRDDARARHDHTAANQALSALNDLFPKEVREPPQWPQCEQLLGHVLELAEASDQPTSTAKPLIDLLNRACGYLIAAKAGQRAVEVTRSALHTAERILGAEDPDALTTRNSLALAYRDAECVDKAIEIFEPLLGDRERILGPEHRDTLMTRNKLAGAYRDAGRVDDAIEIFEPLLADRERILGAEHPDTLRTRHNLASAYQARGRVEKAIATFEPLLADYERILGAEHPNTLTTRNNLAGAYYAAARVAEAIAAYESLLADRDRILGAEHPDTRLTRGNLASAYRAASRDADAAALERPEAGDSAR